MKSLAAEYLAYYRWKATNPSREERQKHEQALFDSMQEIAITIASKQPQERLALITLLIEEAKNDDEISYIAAGPLEDMLHSEPDFLRKALLVETRKNVKMRRAVQGIWGGNDTPGGKVLNEVKAELGLK